MLKPTAIVLALLAIGTASPGHSSIFHAQYLGTVSFGFDQSGVFGPTGGNLSGDHFVADFVIDDAAGTYDAQPGYSAVFGGGQSGQSPVGIGTLTINGLSSSSGDFNGGAARAIPAYFGESFVQHFSETRINNSAVFEQDTLNLSILSFSDFFVDNLHLGAPLYHVVNSADQASGLWETFFLDRNTGQSIASSVHLNIDSVAIWGGPAPEPSAWASMLVGFLVIGAALRVTHRNRSSRTRA